jgi:DNA topoisomerase I
MGIKTCNRRVSREGKDAKLAATWEKTMSLKQAVGHIRDLPQRAADIPKEYKKIAWASLGR